MATTIRLPPRIEQALATYCVESRRTKSEVIIELLDQRFLGTFSEASPYALAQATGFIGCADASAGASKAAASNTKTGTHTNTAANAKQLVRERICAKHSR